MGSSAGGYFAGSLCWVVSYNVWCLFGVLPWYLLGFLLVEGYFVCDFSALFGLMV